MLELIYRIAKAEAVLAGSLSEASLRRSGEGARRFKKLALAKKRLSRELLTGAARVKASSKRPPVICGLAGLKDSLDSSLLFLSEAIASGLEEAGLAEALAAHERFKWNGLVDPLAREVRKGFPEGACALLAAERARRAVVSFLETADARQDAFALKAPGPAWTEALLLVGDLPDETSAALSEHGVVEKTGPGDAIDRIMKRYYGAVITVDGPAHAKAAAVCEKAARVFPGIEERFLRLPKSASAKRAAQELGVILYRQRRVKITVEKTGQTGE